MFFPALYIIKLLFIFAIHLAARTLRVFVLLSRWIRCVFPLIGFTLLPLSYRPSAGNIVVGRTFPFPPSCLFQWNAVSVFSFLYFPTGAPRFYHSEINLPRPSERWHAPLAFFWKRSCTYAKSLFLSLSLSHTHTHTHSLWFDSAELFQYLGAGISEKKETHGGTSKHRKLNPRFLFFKAAIFRPIHSYLCKRVFHPRASTFSRATSLYRCKNELKERTKERGLWTSCPNRAWDWLLTSYARMTCYARREFFVPRL